MTDTYRIRPVETWLLARDDYLGGLTAETVCRIHDLGLSAFRKRARKYGWRRMDHFGDPAAEQDRSIYDDVEVEEQIETARLRFLQTLEQGNALEARRWRTLWSELRTEANAFNEQFFRDMTPEAISAFYASPDEDEDSPEDAALLSAPRRDPYDD